MQLRYDGNRKFLSGVRGETAGSTELEMQLWNCKYWKILPELWGEKSNDVNRRD